MKQVKFGSLKEYEKTLSIDDLKKKVEECKDVLHKAEAKLCFEMSQQGVRGYSRDGLNQAQYILDGARVSLRKAQENYAFAVEQQNELLRRENIEVSPQYVMIKELEDGKTLITIGGTFNYTFTRQRCIAIVKELQDGKWRKMKKPTPLFQNDAKTVKRQKKNQRGSVTTEQSTTQGEHARFCEKHLESDKAGNWRIALHKQKTS